MGGIKDRTLYQLTLIIILSSILRIFNISSMAPGIDEDFTKEALSLSVNQMIGLLSGQGFTPPFYYFLAYAASHIGGLAAVKLLSVVFGVATVIATYFLAMKMFGKRLAFASGILMAFLPMAVFYSQHMRTYSLLMFLFATSLLVLLNFTKTSKNKYLAALTAINIMILYTHYEGFIIVASQVIFLGLRPFFKKQGIKLPIKSITISYLVSFLSFAIWVFYAGYNGARILNGFWVNFGLFNVPYIFYKFSVGVNISTLVTISPIIVLSVVPIFFSFALGIYLARKKADFMPYILLISLPFVLSSLVSFIVPVLHYRFLSYLLPLFVIGIANCSNLGKKSYAFFLVIIGIWFAFDLLYYSISVENMWNNKIGL